MLNRTLTIATVVALSVSCADIAPSVPDAGDSGLNAVRRQMGARFLRGLLVGRDRKRRPRCTDISDADRPGEAGFARDRLVLASRSGPLATDESPRVRSWPLCDMAVTGP